jgi:hypothetical protein
MQIVLPNGQVKEVTERDEDLWFALKVQSSSVSEHQVVVLTIVSRFREG